MATRFCPRCGKEVSTTSRFCAHCGAPLLAEGGAPSQRAVTMEMASNNTRRVLVPLAILVAVVLAVIIAVLAARLHQEALLASRTVPVTAPPITNAPSQPVAAPPITNAPTQPVAAPPITNADSGPGQLPADVAAYLQFLKGIEARRVALANDTSGASAMIGAVQNLSANKDDPDQDPEQQQRAVQQNLATLDQGYSQYQAKWQALFADFRSVTPPAACSPLANKYWIALSEYPAIIAKTQDILSNLKPGAIPDFSALLQADSVLSQAEHQVNSALTDADAALAALCDRYNAPKPFSIQPDGSGSSLLGS